MTSWWKCRNLVFSELLYTRVVLAILVSYSPGGWIVNKQQVLPDTGFLSQTIATAEKF